jgi:hypothetical protein
VHKEFKHENDKDTKQRLNAEHAQFKDTSTTQATRHTQVAAQAHKGEHIHHHVHETIQPVIHKETIQPEVVHTTVPVHETHHIESQHLDTSTLPMKTLEGFEHADGNLTGTNAQPQLREQYEGCPRPYEDSIPINSKNQSSGPQHDTVSRPVQPNTSVARDTNDQHSPGTIFNSQHTPNESGSFNSTKHAGTHANETSTQPSAGAVAAGKHAASHASVRSDATSRSAETDSDGSGKKHSIMDRLNPLKHA